MKNVLLYVSLLLLMSCTVGGEPSATIRITSDTSNQDPSGNDQTNVDNTATTNEPNSIILQIEDAPNGTGSEITAQTISDAITLYAVTRDGNGDFIENVTVNWSESASLGSFSIITSSATIYSPSNNSGETIITATHSSLGSKTLTLTISNVVNDSFITNITGLTLWNKADSLADTHSDNDAISSWIDSSNPTLAASQATQSYRPIFKESGLNGHPSVYFDGVNDLLNTQRPLSDMIKANESTLFLVVNVSDINTNTLTHPFFNDAIFADTGCFYTISLRKSGSVSTLMPALYPGQAKYNSHYINLNSSILISVKHNGSTLVSRVNKSNQVTDNVGAIYSSAHDALNYGTVHFGADTYDHNYFQGHISEVIMFDTAISESDQNDIEDHLCQKYDLICN